MSRLLLVICLIVSLQLCSCSSRQPAQTAATQKPHNPTNDSASTDRKDSEPVATTEEVSTTTEPMSRWRDMRRATKESLQNTAMITSGILLIGVTAGLIALILFAHGVNGK